MPPALVDPGDDQGDHTAEGQPREPLDGVPADRRLGGRPEEGDQQRGEPAEPRGDGQQMEHVDRHGDARLEPLGGVLRHRPARGEPGRHHRAPDREPEGQVPLLLVLPLVVGPEQDRYEQRGRGEQQQPGDQCRAGLGLEHVREQRQVEDVSRFPGRGVGAAQQQQPQRGPGERQPSGDHQPLHRPHPGAAPPAGEHERRPAGQDHETGVGHVPADAVQHADHTVVGALRRDRDGRLGRGADGEGEGPGDGMAVRRHHLVGDGVRAVGQPADQRHGVGRAARVGRGALVHPLALGVEHPHGVVTDRDLLGEGQRDLGGRRVDHRTPRGVAVGQRGVRGRGSGPGEERAGDHQEQQHQGPYAGSDGLGHRGVSLSVRSSGCRWPPSPGSRP